MKYGNVVYSYIRYIRQMDIMNEPNLLKLTCKEPYDYHLNIMDIVYKGNKLYSGSYENSLPLKLEFRIVVNLKKIVNQCPIYHRNS